MLRTFALTLLLVCMSLAPAHAQDATAEEQAVSRAVYDYFHGQGEQSRERMRRAFAADYATMVSIIPNQQGVDTVRTFRDMNDVIQRWTENENPPNGARDGEILETHILDGRLATVFFRYEDRYYDAITLVKINGEWKIVSRAFIRQQH